MTFEMTYSESNAYVKIAFAVLIALLTCDTVQREQSMADFGIDALIEICEHGQPSGQLIALQIKSGESFFREHTTQGFIYRGSKAHLDYWVGHSLPVFLVLYHPGFDEAWWCAITAETVERTSKGWRIAVPFNQRFGESSRSHMVKYAPPELGRRAQLADLASEFPADRLMWLFDVLALAQREIDVASSFIDERLFWTLSAVALRGIRVRLLTGQVFPENLRDDSRLPGHVAWGWRSALGLHEKCIVVDHILAISGSANFTSFSYVCPAEVVVASVDTRIVTETCKSFAGLWKNGLEVAPNTAPFRPR
jgi:hypothetical protein